MEKHFEEWKWVALFGQRVSFYRVDFLPISNSDGRLVKTSKVRIILDSSGIHLLRYLVQVWAAVALLMNFRHESLSWAFRTAAVKSRPVIYLMLSAYRFFGFPRNLFTYNVPVIRIFSKLQALNSSYICPKYCSLLRSWILFSSRQSSSIFLRACWLVSFSVAR